MPTTVHYAVTVFAWGFTWTAIHLQVGEAPLAVSIFYRFALAGAILLLAVAARRAFPRGDVTVHLWLVAQGLCLFCINFLFLYKATSLVPSGLVAVIFSMASLFNAANAWLFTRQAPSVRVMGAAVLGVTGITCLFWPQLQWSDGAGIGLLYAVAGTYSFSLGNMIGPQLQRLSVDVLPGNACAMGYGALALAVWIGLRGFPLELPTTAAYWGAMVFLVFIGTLAGFGSYLTLIRRLGAVKAGYVTVLFPVVALTASTWLEGYHWTLLAVVGAAMAVSGNIVMLWRPGRNNPRPATEAPGGERPPA